MPIENDPDTGVVLKLALQQVVNTGTGDVTRLMNWIVNNWRDLPIAARLEVYTYMTRVVYNERRFRETKPGMLSLTTECELEEIYNHIRSNMGA